MSDIQKGYQHQFGIDFTLRFECIQWGWPKHCQRNSCRTGQAQRARRVCSLVRVLDEQSSSTGQEDRSPDSHKQLVMPKHPSNTVNTKPTSASLLTPTAASCCVSGIPPTIKSHRLLSSNDPLPLLLERNVACAL